VHSVFLFASHSEKLAISIRAPFLCAQRFLFASHSEKLTISIRSPFFVRSVILLASHSEKLAISLLFASHSEKLTISIRAPFFERSVFYLRAFLCAQHFLFASHSGKLAISIRAPFWKALLLGFFGFAQWNISIVVLYISLLGGERYFVQEDLLSHEYSPPRPSVARTNSFGLGAPSF